MSNNSSVNPSNIPIDEDKCSLKIKGVSKIVDEKHLLEIFEEFGQISDVKRIQDYYLIRYKSYENMESAFCTMHHAEIDEQPIIIQFVSSDYKAVNERFRSPP